MEILTIVAMCNDADAVALAVCVKIFAWKGESRVQKMNYSDAHIKMAQFELRKTYQQHR